MDVADIPSDTEIRHLDLGALISLRGMLVAMTGATAASYLTTYEEILTDTLALAALLTGKAKHAETLPPEPEWVSRLENEPGDDLDDPEVEYRICQLIALGKTDEEIWAIIETEFTFNFEGYHENSC
jgi:hypothetical protein